MTQQTFSKEGGIRIILRGSESYRVPDDRIAVFQAVESTLIPLYVKQNAMDDDDRRKQALILKIIASPEFQICDSMIKSLTHDDRTYGNVYKWMRYLRGQPLVSEVLQKGDVITDVNTINTWAEPHNANGVTPNSVIDSNDEPPGNNQQRIASRGY